MLEAARGDCQSRDSHCEAPSEVFSGQWALPTPCFLGAAPPASAT